MHFDIQSHNVCTMLSIPDLINWIVSYELVSILLQPDLALNKFAISLPRMLPVWNSWKWSWICSSPAFQPVLAFIFKLKFQSNNASRSRRQKKMLYSEYSHTSSPSNATAVLSLHKSLIRGFQYLITKKKLTSHHSFAVRQYFPYYVDKQGIKGLWFLQNAMASHWQPLRLQIYKPVICHLDT